MTQNRSPYYAVITRDGIYDMLIALKRKLLPAHTSESPEDPLVALLAMMSYEGQRQSAMLDMAARELLPEELERRGSLVALARLSGYTLTSYRPSSVLVVADVRGTPPAGATVLPTLAQFATRGLASQAVVFEYLDDPVVLPNPDPLEAEDILIYDDSAGTYAAALPWAPWATADVEDAILFRHGGLVWDRVSFAVAAAGWPAAALPTFEYYEDHQKALPPDSVADNGDGTIDVDCSDFLRFDGQDVPVVTGLVVRVTCLDTGVSEDAAVDNTGTLTTTTQLGQTVVSTDPNRYLVTAEWRPLLWEWDDDPVGAAGPLQATASWSLPFDGDHRWSEGTLNGLTGFWCRMRLYSAAGAPLTLDSEPSASADTDDVQYSVAALCVQGFTVNESLGVTTGAANQQFALSNTPIEGSLVEFEVGGATWVIVDSLFGRGPEAQAGVLRELADGTWVIRVGDDTNGAIPASSLAVTATFRTGALRDGNVGSGVVQINRSGEPYLTGVRNPEAASGWATRAADESLGDIGLLAAESARAAHVRSAAGALTPGAISLEVTELTLSDGTTPVARAAIYEEGAGYASVEVRVVGVGGALLTAAQLDELDEYFNGTTKDLARFGGVSAVNLVYSFLNYVPQDIDGSVVVEVIEGHSQGVQTLVQETLRAYLSPLHVRTDGTFTHGVAGTVRKQAVEVALALVIDNLVTVTVSLTGGSPDVDLATGSLPTFGSWTITVNEVVA